MAIKIVTKSSNRPNNRKQVKQTNTLLSLFLQGRNFNRVIIVSGVLVIFVALLCQILVWPAQFRFQEDAYGSIQYPNDEPTITTKRSPHHLRPAAALPLRYNETFGKPPRTKMTKNQDEATQQEDGSSFDHFTASTSTRTRTTSAAAATEPPPEDLWLITPVPFPHYNRTATLEAWKNNPKQPAAAKPSNTSTTSKTDDDALVVVEDVVIPRIIHKVLLSKTGAFSAAGNIENHGDDDEDFFESQSHHVKRAHSSWMIRNPGYDMIYFDLKAARAYLQTHFHPVFLRAFDCIEAFAGKTNLIRYAILYREGGWYSDWKEECLVNNLLEEKLSPRKDLVFFMDRGLKISEMGEFVMNSFIGAAPRHPFWAAALKQVLLNVQQEFYGEQLPTQDTGPGMLGMVRKNLINNSRDLPADDYYELRRLLDFSGTYKWNRFYFDNDPDTTIIRHKCEGCDNTRSWGSDGNDYPALHKDRRYYCQDAKSIFVTTTATGG